MLYINFKNRTGDLQEMIDALQAADLQERLKESALSA